MEPELELDLLELERARARMRAASMRQQETPRPMAPMGMPAESTRTPRQTPLSRTERVQAAQRRENMQAIAERQREAIPAVLANIAKDIPGAEAAQAGARALARGQSYREALGDVRQATEALPTAVRTGTRMAGAALAGVAMPGSTAARQAALYGALSGVTEASPDLDVRERLVRGGLSAALGGGVAKTLQAAGAGIRGFFAPSTSAQLLQQQATRNVTAGPLYEELRGMGTLPRTGLLQDILDLPVVKQAVRRVRQSDPNLRNAPDTDAALLSEVYQRIGKRAFREKFGSLVEARQQLFVAINDAAAEKVATTGTGTFFQDPVRTFRAGSELMGATMRGAKALARTGQEAGAQSQKALLSESPEALAEWAKTATPAQRQAAIRGILGDALPSGRFPNPLRLSRAGTLVEMLERAGQPPARTQQIATLSGARERVTRPVRDFLDRLNAPPTPSPSRRLTTQDLSDLFAQMRAQPLLRETGRMVAPTYVVPRDRSIPNP